jgi:hypothetical protein
MNKIVIIAIIVGIIIITVFVLLILWNRGIIGKRGELPPSEELPSDLMETGLDFELPAESTEVTMPAEEETSVPVPMESTEEIASKPTPLKPATGESWFKLGQKPNPILGKVWKYDPGVKLLNQQWMGDWIETGDINVPRNSCVKNTKCQGVYGDFYRDPDDFAKPRFRLLGKAGSINPKSAQSDTIFTKFGISKAGRWTYLPRVWKYNRRIIPTGQSYLGNWVKQQSAIVPQKLCENSPKCKGVHINTYKTDSGKVLNQYRLMENVGKPSGKIMPETNLNIGTWFYLPRI